MWRNIPSRTPRETLMSPWRPTFNTEGSFLRSASVHYKPKLHNQTTTQPSSAFDAQFAAMCVNYYFNYRYGHCGHLRHLFATVRICTEGKPKHKFCKDRLSVDFPTITFAGLCFNCSPCETLDKNGFVVEKQKVAIEGGDS